MKNIYRQTVDGQQEGQMTDTTDYTIKYAYRVRDVVIAFLGLIVLLPLFAMIAIMIKRDSTGPIFYWGPRAGKDGVLFRILKFRTMYDRPESFQGAKITGQGDPRITRIGQWLRDTKLNELPQLWNVLIGEMSLVGPRPEDPDIVTEWAEETRQIILSVPPGITSPASVLYRDEEALLPSGDELHTYLKSVAPKKIRLDQIYVNNRTYWMDLDVLFWTLLVLIPRLGNHKLPEEQLLWGPISRLIRRELNWFSIDTIVAFLAFGASSIFLRTFFGPLDIGWFRLIFISVGFAILFSIIGALTGIQNIYWSKAPAMDSLYLIPSISFSMLVSLIINWYVKICPADLLIVGSGTVFIGFVIIRYRGRLLTGLASRLLSRWRTPAIARERVLIVGGGNSGQSAAWMLENNGSASVFHVVGFVDDDIYKKRLRIRGVEVLGQRDDIPDLVERHDIGIIVFAIHNLVAKARQDVLDICNQTHAQVVLMPDFIGRISTVASILSSIHAVENRIHSNANVEI